MNDILQKQIMDVIRESLPSAQATSLREYLEETKELKAKLKGTEKQLTEKNEQLQKVQETVAILTKREMKLDALNKLKEEVDNQVRQQRIFELETLLAAEKDKMITYIDLVSTVFKNQKAVYTANTSGLMPVTLRDYGSSCDSIQPHPIDLTTTTTKSEQTE